jgi:hypothetical protein
MHTIKSTFWTRKGQFQKDQNTEAFGIARVALDGWGDYICQIEGRAGVYKQDKQVIKDFVAQHSFWKSHKGKSTAIVPLYLFEYQVEAKKNNQQTLI